MKRKGDILHKSTPFISMLTREHISSHCSYCFKEFPSRNFWVRVCEGCQLVRYCSLHCQDADFKEFHNFECKLYGKCLPLQDDVRMMIRLLHKLNHQKGYEDFDLVFKSDSQGCRLQKRYFQDLLSHKEEMFSEDKMAHAIQAIHRITQSYLGVDQVPNLDAFGEIFGRLVINGFEICDEFGNNKAWGIYLGASVIDHSCCPNAHVVFEGRHIYVRALQDFENHSCTQLECKFQTHLDMGTEVKISYIDVMEHTLIRRKKLSDTYYFTCQCQRCLGFQLTWRPTKTKTELQQQKRPNPVIEDMMYSIRCQICSEGFPIIIGPTMENIDQCKKCSQKPTEEVLQKYLGIKEEVEDHLDKGTIPFGIPQKCVSLMTGLFYPQHILYVKASELAFEDCFYAKKWIEALDYGNLCLNSYKAFSLGDQIWGNLGPISYKLALVYERLENEQKMTTLLEEAKKVIAVTHGKKHKLFQEILRKLSTCSDL